jgi:hypothetical protein
MDGAMRETTDWLSPYKARLEKEFDGRASALIECVGIDFQGRSEISQRA